MNRRELLLATAALGAGAPAALAQTPQRAHGSTGAEPTLPAPTDTSSVSNYPTRIGWAEGQAPTAPEGFRVTRLAAGLANPRWLHVLPNGDVLVAESATKRGLPADEDERIKVEAQTRAGVLRDSADRITLLRDPDGDGVAEQRQVLLDGLNQPFGMAFRDGALFVANTDAVLRFPLRPGDTRIEDRGTRILALPAGGYNNHWTRNLLLSRDGARLLVSVGSASNVGEHGMEEESRRACIRSIRPDGSDERAVAIGLRNPVGMDFHPATGALWTAVNERDQLGDELVPDYMTAVRQGADYGWPFAYWGSNEDPRRRGENPARVAAAITPDYALGAHTASLGLAFCTSDAFPERYRGGAFVGQHGSWNRREFSGYRVAFVPFRDGRPSGPPEDFLSGFMADPRAGTVRGRPVGVAMDGRGGLLVADDTGDAVWRVAPGRG